MLSREQLAPLEAQYGLPSGLLYAQMMQESGGNPNAQSPKGALGLFQFMPETAKAYGVDPMDPQSSALGAARMMGDLMKQYDNNLPMALAGYNWGSGNIARQGMERMPAETQNYIKSITGKLQQTAQAPAGVMTDANVVNQPPQPNASQSNLDDIVAWYLDGEKAGVLDEEEKKWLEEGRAAGFVPKLQQPAAEAKKPGFKQRIGEDWRRRVADTQKFANRDETGRPSQLGTLNALGNAAGLLGDVAVEGATSVDQALGSPLATLFQDVGQNTKGGRAIGSALESLGQAREFAFEKAPVMSNTAGSLLNLAGLAPAASALESAVTAGAKAVPMPKAKTFVKYASPDAHKAMNELYKEQSKTADNYWDTARDIGVDIKPPNVDELKRTLPAIINNIENNPAHPKAGLLPELKRWNDKLQGGTKPIEGSPELLGKPYLDAKGRPVQVPDPSQDFTAADAMNMRTSWNQHFKSNQFSQDPAYGAVSSAIDKTLESAATTNPLFGKAHELAKKQWLNNVKYAFGDKAFKKFFPAEDFSAYASYERGLAEKLPLSTEIRIEQMIPKIKTVAELEAVRKILPPDIAAYVGREVIRRAESGELAKGISAVAGASPTPAGATSALRGIYNFVTGADKTDEVRAIIDAAKKPPQRLTSYDAEYQQILQEMAKQGKTK